ncbi:ROK family protein [candidate division KSB1 bacterium]|nr:ROK family protein [candidate division KSB1 bacterium]MCH8871823.1 ROK family protein [candidate division KSB1 bacterium]
MKEKNILGLDLGGTNARAGLVRNQQLGQVSSIKINPNGSVDEVLAQICGLIDESKPENLDGIGIGVPSVVDIEKGIVYDVQNIPSWKEVPIKSIMQERYSTPTFVNNDANCFALGEKYFGKGVGYQSIIGLILGTGFGGGVIVDGKSYAGVNCGAGEFGMIPYLDSIYEHYCSGQFFTRNFQQTGEEVFQRAVRDEEEALKVWTEYGRHLGNGIKTILHAYDPEIIILGGSVRKALRFFEQSMWESIESFTYSNSIKRLKIEVSELDHIAILGAAALYYDAERA